MAKVAEGWQRSMEGMKMSIAVEKLNESLIPFMSLR